MSESTDTSTAPSTTGAQEPAQPAAAATETPAPEPTATPDTLGDGGKAALQAERKARREAEKAAADALAKVKEFEQRDLSAQEKLAQQVQELEAKAARAEAEALRLRIAADTDLPADLHEFLVGSTEEELRAKAEKLKAATASGARRPQPDPSQGAKPDSTGPTQLTQADLTKMSADEITAALSDGRLADVLKAQV